MVVVWIRNLGFSLSSRCRSGGQEFDGGIIIKVRVWSVHPGLLLVVAILLYFIFSYRWCAVCIFQGICVIVPALSQDRGIATIVFLWGRRRKGRSTLITYLHVASVLSSRNVSLSSPQNLVVRTVDHHHDGNHHQILSAPSALMTCCDTIPVQHVDKLAPSLLGKDPFVTI